ncbi:MAG TPA: Cof-type HAD-IIB family hydrolase [Acholeplasma sp.]|nr:Cof-type HAD-IIB family hydrolase [Acholeplasma sp.]
MKKDKWLIVVDIDGTLIKDFTKYDYKSMDYLKTLNKKHDVVIATGRAYKASEELYHYMELDGPIINFNGSYTHNPNNLKLKIETTSISKKLILKTIADFMEEKVLLNAFTEHNDDVFTYKQDPFLDSFFGRSNREQKFGPLDKLLKTNQHSCFLTTIPGSVPFALEYAKKNFPEGYALRIWKDDHEYAFLEIYNLQASKGLAIKRIVEQFGYDPKKTIAIGDGHNDLEMIECVEYGVAMENAHPDLLKAAKYKTDTIDNSGVYTFLKKLEDKNII